MFAHDVTAAMLEDLNNEMQPGWRRRFIHLRIRPFVIAFFGDSF